MNNSHYMWLTFFPTAWPATHQDACKFILERKSAGTDCWKGMSLTCGISLPCGIAPLPTLQHPPEDHSKFMGVRSLPCSAAPPARLPSSIHLQSIQSLWECRCLPCSAAPPARPPASTCTAFKVYGSVDAYLAVPLLPPALQHPPAKHSKSMGV